MPALLATQPITWPPGAPPRAEVTPASTAHETTPTIANRPAIRPADAAQYVNRNPQLAPWLSVSAVASATSTLNSHGSAPSADRFRHSRTSATYAATNPTAPAIVSARRRAPPCLANALSSGHRTNPTPT